MIEKISLANSHLPQLIGLVLMSIGYTLGNKFYLPEIKQKSHQRLLNLLKAQTCLALKLTVFVIKLLIT